MVDTHAHLYLDDYSNDFQAVIERTKSVGIEKVIMPGIESSFYGKMLQIKQEHPDLFALAVGTHPCHAHEVDGQKELQQTEDFLKNHLALVCAVGEIGLDLYWDKSTLPTQVKIFEGQLELALKYELPIIIHCREAFEETFEVLDRKSPNIDGVFHCFTGTLEEAKAVVARGMKLGIGGVVTFKNTHLREVLKEIPIEYILLETDAPYLAPMPYRGKRNESSYLTEIVKTLSAVYTCSEEEIIQRTTKTAKVLFGL